MQKTEWREDILRRAEDSMNRRRSSEEAEAVRRLIERDLQLEKREALAWRVMIGLIMSGCLVSLALRFFGVER